MTQELCTTVWTPLVSKELPNEWRCYTDLTYAITQLEGAMETVMNRVEEKVFIERKRIDSIRSRIKNCEAKVSAMSEARKKRATTVMSTSRYPEIKEINKSLVRASGSIWLASDEGAALGELDDDENCALVMEKNSLGTASLELWTRLNPRRQERAPQLRMEDEGLAEPPQDIKSCAALLLFNTNGYTPYRGNYQYGTDNLAGRQVSVNEPQEHKDDDAKLAEAPETILKGLELPDVAQLDYQYKPEMGEMTRLDLPENLPLPDIADVSFAGGADLPAIAPSIHRIGAADFLPSLPQDDSPVATVSAPSSNVIPPPPPPPTLATEKDKASEPPPPPPPPPQVNATKPPVPVPEHADKKTAGAKLNLMSAIKGFSVEDLKKREEEDVARAKQTKPASDQPISMLDEMRARMHRRQRALSGKEVGDQSENVSPRSRPPPPPPKSKSSALPKVVGDDDDDDNRTKQDHSIPRLKAKPMQPTQQKQPRGSLFDQDHPVLNKMLAPPWRQGDSHPDDDDDDWNDDGADDDED